MSTATLTAPTFLVVDQHVARNPVARAVARARLAQATRDFITRLYLLADGEDVAADVHASAMVLAVAIAVQEAAGRGTEPDTRVMAGAMGALVDITRRGSRWHTRDAVAIDTGLQRAVAVYTTATAQQVQDAHRRVAALEARA